MSEFFLSFIRSSLDLFNIDLFAYLFFAFVGLFSICFLRFLIWGK